MKWAKRYRRNGLDGIGRLGFMLTLFLVPAPLELFQKSSLAAALGSGFAEVTFSVAD